MTPVAERSVGVDRERYVRRLVLAHAGTASNRRARSLQA